MTSKGGVFMLKMIIELDEKRMKRDGMDVEEAWGTINDTVAGIKEIITLERGVFITTNAGARSWFMKLLRNMEWFMKYVSQWMLDDPSTKDDIIESLQKLGYKCSYE